MMILIAGPVRSGTNGDPALIDANLAKMNRMALEVYQRGHTPVFGVCPRRSLIKKSEPPRRM